MTDTMTETRAFTQTQLDDAKDAIIIRTQIGELQKDLDDILGGLLPYSNGDSYTIPIPGQGSVQIIAATEAGLPSGTFDYVFHKDKFLEMSEAQIRKLHREGVVKLEEKFSSARKASLRITLNK